MAKSAVVLFLAPIYILIFGLSMLASKLLPDEFEAEEFQPSGFILSGQKAA